MIVLAEELVTEHKPWIAHVGTMCSFCLLRPGHQTDSRAFSFDVQREFYPIGGMAKWLILRLSWTEIEALFLSGAVDGVFYDLILSWNVTDVK